MIQFPTGQGYVPSFKNAEIDVAGFRVLGVKSVSWDEACEGDVEYGNGLEPLGVTVGEYKANVEIEQLFSEYLVLRQRAGGREKGFNIGFQVPDPVVGVISVVIPACRLGNNSASWSGTPGLAIKYKCQVLRMIEINGLTIVQRAQSGVGLSVGSVVNTGVGLASSGAAGAVSLPL